MTIPSRVCSSFHHKDAVLQVCWHCGTPCSTTFADTVAHLSAGEQVGSLHGWNQIELLCIGERVRIVSNGVLVTDWTDPDPSLVAAGPIALQLHKMDPGMVRRPPRLALGFFGLLCWVFED